MPSKLDSLRTWQVFAPALPRNPDGPPEKRKCFIPDRHSTVAYTDGLQPYIRHLSSDISSWLMSISLYDSPYDEVTLSQANLLQLGALNNLTKLCIHSWSLSTTKRSELVSDRIIRAWSNHSEQHGYFSNLKALLIGGQADLTPLSMEYLQLIPSLRLLSVYDCWNGRQNRLVEPHGWRSKDSTHLIGNTQPKVIRVEEEDTRTRMPSTKATWAQLIDTFIFDNQHSIVESADTTPLLTASIGFSDCDSTNVSDLAELFCFERCIDEASSMVMNSSSSSSSGSSSKDASGGSSGRPPAEKRRKVKESKYRALDDLLTGYT